MSNSRERLESVTKIVADTGDLESIGKLKPVDATTNPSLILEAVNNPKYSDLVDSVIQSVQNSNVRDKVAEATDELAVAFGTEISKIVPGYISTEVDARLSFDTEATVAKAHKIIRLYQQKGVSQSRILIKIAGTWEGIKAAKSLEMQGIHCNITLVFNFYQAVAAAMAKVTLLSPYVGRIYDWYKEKEGRDFDPEEDPGVLSMCNYDEARGNLVRKGAFKKNNKDLPVFEEMQVRRIYNYFKKQGHQTIVMGASFRSVEQVLALAGCDRLTISPTLLEQLETMKEEVPVKLDQKKAKEMDIESTPIDERIFRWQLNEDPMATEKLAEGIRNFARDAEKLEAIVRSKLEPTGRQESTAAEVSESSLASGQQETHAPSIASQASSQESRRESSHESRASAHGKPGSEHHEQKGTELKATDSQRIEKDVHG